MASHLQPRRAIIAVTWILNLIWDLPRGTPTRPQVLVERSPRG
jgi:hypothetical protein